MDGELDLTSWLATASALITSQLPTGAWHEYLGGSAIADWTLDRILHNAHLLEVKGEWMRRQASTEQAKKSCRGTFRGLVLSCLMSPLPAPHG